MKSKRGDVSVSVTFTGKLARMDRGITTPSEKLKQTKKFLKLIKCKKFIFTISETCTMHVWIYLIGFIMETPTLYSNEIQQY